MSPERYRPLPTGVLVAAWLLVIGVIGGSALLIWSPWITPGVRWQSGGIYTYAEATRDPIPGVVARIRRGEEIVFEGRSDSSGLLNYRFDWKGDTDPDRPPIVQVEHPDYTSTSWELVDWRNFPGMALREQ